jgi:hypothetical protein
MFKVESTPFFFLFFLIKDHLRITKIARKGMFEGRKQTNPDSPQMA